MKAASQPHLPIPLSAQAYITSAGAAPNEITSASESYCSPKASLDNEQNQIDMAGDGRRVVFKQIAGALARRIVFRKKPGDHCARGERVGMIRFGSRVDVFLPPETTVSVKPGDRVKAGLSVVARFPETR